MRKAQIQIEIINHNYPAMQISQFLNCIHYSHEIFINISENSWNRKIPLILILN